MDAARQIEQSVLQQLKAPPFENSGAHTMEASIMAKVESRLAASHGELDARINSLDGRSLTSRIPRKPLAKSLCSAIGKN